MATLVVAALVLLSACAGPRVLESSGTTGTGATTPGSSIAPPRTLSGTPGSTAAPTTTAFVPPPLPAASAALPSPGDNRVFVLGDSVILGAQVHVPRDLVGWKVTFDAAESRLVNHGVAALKARRQGVDDVAAAARVDLEKAYADAGLPPPRSDPPASVVESLGHVFVIHICTNYLAGGGFDTFVDQFMQYLKDATRVVWVTCGVWSSGQPEANAAILAAARKYPNVVACDWAAYAPTPGFTYNDGIHLTEAGATAMGQLVARCVGPAPTPPPPAPTTTRPKPTTTTTTTPPVTPPIEQPPPA